MKRFLTSLKAYLRRSDTFLLALCLLCTVLGIIAISTAVSSVSSIYVQIGATVIGLVLYFILSVIDIDIIADKWKPLTALGLLLIVSLIWLGDTRGGNKAWIRFAGIGIQPAELVKIIFIVSLARLITFFKDADRLDHPVSVMLLALFFLIHFGVIIVASSDTGSALVYLFIFVVMIFAAGIKFYWLAGAAALLVLAAPYLWYYLLNDNYRTRILAIFIPGEIDPTGRGVLWQTNLSKAALAAGGIFGKGFYNGAPAQTDQLPLRSSDFILAVIGEQFGIVGCVVVVALLTVIIVHCVRVGLRSQSRLGALACIGVAAMVAFQTLENVGMCIGVAPVIGLTLPFFSYGGSSIVTLYAAMGLVSGVKMKPKPTMFLK